MRKTSYPRIFLSLCLAHCLAQSHLCAQSFPYKFNYLTVDNGLSHTDANDIAQDKRGFIWVATYYGLDRYDGYTIKKYYNRNVPRHNAYKNRLIGVFPGDSGYVWLSSEDGIQRFDTRTEKYLDYKDPKAAGNPGFQKIYKSSGNDLYGLSGNRLQKYSLLGQEMHEQKLDIPSGLLFTDMAPDRQGNLFFSSNKGLWTIDGNNHLSRVAINGLADQEFTGLYFDAADRLLLLSGNKIIRPGIHDAKTNTFISSQTIKSIVQGAHSDYWVNTGAALLRLDSALNLIQAVNDRNDLHGLNSRSITRILVDRSQCLWVATFGGGVNYCDLNEKPFYTLRHIPDGPPSLSGNHIRSILEDGDDLWIGTHANGLNRWNKNTQSFTYYNTGHAAVQLKSDGIASLALDDSHNLWLGSGSGIEILKPDRKSLWKPPGYDSFPSYIIETLAKDCYGNIWFGNHTDKFGVIWKDHQNYFHVRYYGEGYFILADKKKPELFISSTQGLKCALIDSQGNISKTYYYLTSDKPNSLSSNYTYPVVKQDDSTYWIGTIGGGLDRLSISTMDTSFKVKVFSGSEGVFDDVESLEIDNMGKLWMGGNGLECLDPLTGKLIRYDRNDGLQGNSFKVGASFKGADGKLYFGGINGLNYFSPDQVNTNGLPAEPVLTGILINNREPQYGVPDSSGNTLQQTIGSGQELKLNHLQNNFVIFFSSMHFANQLKCQYRYRLAGFDRDWKFTDGKNPSAAYSNLDYGRYTFIVEATNNDGVWSKGQASTVLIISPPWWKSTLAKSLYILLILSILAGIYIYQARWYRLKRELAIRALVEKRREEAHQQREQLYQQQLTFFTNISHEFRTPLSLILGPLESLIGQKKNASPEQLYQLMFRNAKRLVNLIRELMNFKKVADSVIKLQVQFLDIREFCRKLSAEFQTLADSKDIDFTTSGLVTDESSGPVRGQLDAGILEKILLNLLDNAFKYTDAGGKISFDLFFDRTDLKPAFSNGFQLLHPAYRANNYLYFRIADTGIGISAESLANIFDRYYRVPTHHLGSGIGLALVKNLTQLHKGDIFVYSQRNEGTEIIIGLPWGKENYEASETLAPGTIPAAGLEPLDKTPLYALPDTEMEKRPAPSELQKHILLVDDNSELRRFLRQSLEKDYTVEEAEDGHSALEIAIGKVPDLIISDVMMPGMNGIEFCQLIKERFETRHIPFIILSAKDAVETKIEGMTSGADYYFSKPLSLELLLLTIHNIFDQAEFVKQRYIKDYLSEATDLAHSEKDKEFLQELGRLIEDNIGDPDLDVDFLCERLLISRTKLYQKIQSISDQSVAGFIRTIRLKKAILIMTHEDIPMNEVAYRIGMQSGSNFSRAFKKEYGSSPLQFMQSLKKG